MNSKIPKPKFKLGQTVWCLYEVHSGQHWCASCKMPIGRFEVIKCDVTGVEITQYLDYDSYGYARSNNHIVYRVAQDGFMVSTHEEHSVYKTKKSAEEECAKINAVHAAMAKGK